jgi:hypothetical protein
MSLTVGEESDHCRPQVLGPTVFGANEKHDRSAITPEFVFVTDRRTSEWMGSEFGQGRDANEEVLAWSPGETARCYNA